MHALIHLQLLLLNIALLVSAEAGEITMLLGNDILMVLAGADSPTSLLVSCAICVVEADVFSFAGAIGATQLNPYKWFW